MMKRISFAMLVVTSLFTSVPSATAGTTCSAEDDNKCEAWSTTWTAGLDETPGSAFPETPEDTAAHGDHLFTVGESHDGRQDSDAFILKSDVSSGELLWAKRFSGGDADRPFDTARSVAVSPDGSTVYITGTRRYDFEGHGDVFLAAFAARSGRKLWARAVHKGRSYGVELEVGESGRAIYVTGSGRYDDLSRQVITARYNAKGARLWKRHYGADGADVVEDLAVSASRIFVAASIDKGRRYEATTLSYTSSGKLEWAAAPNEAQQGHLYGGELRVANDLVYRFSTTQEFRESGGPVVSEMYAFEADTGAVAWADVTTNVETGYVSGTELALSPDGGIVYAVGLPGTIPGDHFERFDIRAYAAETGTTLWTATYDHPTADSYITDAVARDEGVVVGAILMPGIRRDMLTLGFSRESGSLLWSARHNPSDETNAEVNGGTMTLGPTQTVIHAGNVYFGRPVSGSGYAYNEAVTAAYR